MFSKGDKAGTLSLGRTKRTIKGREVELKQPWEYKKSEKRPAKLFYTIYNGKDAILNIELRYKGSKTVEPQFQATATANFKNLFGKKKNPSEEILDAMDENDVEMAELENHAVEYYKKELTPEEMILKELLENFNINIQEPAAFSMLKSLTDIYEQLVGIKQPQVLLTCEACLINLD